MSNLLRYSAALAAFGAAFAVLLWAFCSGQPAEEKAPELEEPAKEKTPSEPVKRLRIKTDAEWSQYFEEAAKAGEQKRAALIAQEKARGHRPKKRPGRRLRRFTWNTADLRGKLWNVPQAESDDALLTAFVRVCISEADGNPQDCVGIWQVLQNIRRRSCARGFVRRITECEDGGGETMLSALRRAQPHILEAPGYRLRNQRAGWIRNLTPDCEMPKGWTRGEAAWDSHYGSKRCPHVVELTRYLMKGQLPPPRPGVRLAWLKGRPITWGGRCESNSASCDDRIACSRGLARVPDTNTQNAFWCYPGRPGCRQDAEPICEQLGYGHLVGEVVEAGEAEQRQGG